MDRPHLLLTLYCPHCGNRHRMTVSPDADPITKFDYPCWACHGTWAVRLGDYLLPSSQENTA